MRRTYAIIGIGGHSRRCTDVRRFVVTSALCGALAIAGAVPAAAESEHPAMQADCIGAANSNGNGEFVSGIATTVRGAEIGLTTADVLGGPHGLIGVVASSDDCS